MNRSTNYLHICSTLDRKRKGASPGTNPSIYYNQNRTGISLAKYILSHKMLLSSLAGYNIRSPFVLWLILWLLDKMAHIAYTISPLLSISRSESDRSSMSSSMSSPSFRMWFIREQAGGMVASVRICMIWSIVCIG